MRIGIDARLYKKGLGLGRYVEKLISHLANSDSHDEFFLFLNKEGFRDLEFSSPRFHKVLADVGWYTLREQIIMPLLFLKYSCDIVHIPHFNIPLLYPKKMIMTIHDLILIKHPMSATSAASTRHPFIHWVKYRAYRLLLWCAVRRVNHIVAVSYGVKKDLIRLAGVSDKKVSVIYEGVEQKKELPIAEKPDLLKYAKEVYALYVGNSYPHKNVEGLICLFEQFRNAGNHNFLLYLCGQNDYFTNRLKNSIHEKGLADHIIHLGSVSDELLEVLYQNARFFITCSHEEGFGLPPLEAQKNGIPVIVPDVSVFPEILGNSALYIDLSDTQQCIQTMKSIYTNNKLKEVYIQRGYNRSQKFTWDEMARCYLILYHASI